MINKIKKIEYPNLNQIIVVGDIHGNFKDFINKLKRLQITNTLLIQVGDFGLGFETYRKDLEELYNLDTILQETKNHLYILRGNHDFPYYWRKENFEMNMDNLKLIPDYSEINFILDNGNINKNALFVGGGVSIDRFDRLIKYANETNSHDSKCKQTYWEDEIIKDKVDKISKISFDYIFTHVPPKVLFENTTLNTNLIDYFMKKDIHLSKDLEIENKILNKLIKIDFKQIISGHFHMSHRCIFNKNKEGFILDINEFSKIII